MKHILTSLILLLCFSVLFGQADNQFSHNHSGIHKVVVVEVLQTTSYTYLYVKENDDHKWLALPKLNALPGETYYHQDGFEMVDFKSTELERTFESVWFLGGVLSPDDMKSATTGDLTSNHTTGSNVEESRVEVSIEPLENGITIKELYANPGQYTGEIIRIRGKVVKFSDGIMGRNWIHLQDGTEFEGNYDLVATTIESTRESTIIIVEGKVSVDKDFGYGYFYEVIIEEARIIP